MSKKWMRMSAVCLAVLLGCMVPAGTMMAAEEEYTLEAQGTGEDSVSGNDVSSEPDEGGDDAGNADGSQEDGPADEQQPGETELPDAEGQQPGEMELPDAEGQQPIEDSDLQDAELAEDGLEADDPEAAVMAASLETEMQTQDAAPVITIRLQGKDQTKELGGTVDCEYIRNHDQRFSVSVGGSPDALFYYLDAVSGNFGAGKSEQELASLWQPAGDAASVQVALKQDGHYILYIKAVSADGQTVCARSNGIVVDVVAPKIKGIQNGYTYWAGTTFTVEDDNLDGVWINEQAAVPAASGSYQVSAQGNSTSCVIRARDKAGNETVWSITVLGVGGSAGNVISVNGTYSLKSGTAYELGGGRWTVKGDSTVYQGGSKFYVGEDGDYKFTRRWY